MAGLHPVSENHSLFSPTAKAKIGKVLTTAAVVAAVAIAVFAIVAVSTASAGAPAWLIDAALFFESLSAPSIFGFVISVKATVYCMASLMIVLAGCVGLVAATAKQRDSDEYDFEDEFDEVPCSASYTPEAEREEEEYESPQAQQKRAFDSDVRLVKRLFQMGFTEEEIQDNRHSAGETPFSKKIFAAAKKIG